MAFIGTRFPGTNYSTRNDMQQLSPTRESASKLAGLLSLNSRLEGFTPSTHRLCKGILTKEVKYKNGKGSLTVPQKSKSKYEPYKPEFEDITPPDSNSDEDERSQLGSWNKRRITIENTNFTGESKFNNYSSLTEVEPMDVDECEVTPSEETLLKKRNEVQSSQKSNFFSIPSCCDLFGVSDSSTSSIGSDTEEPSLKDSSFKSGLSTPSKESPKGNVTSNTKTNCKNSEMEFLSMLTSPRRAPEKCLKRSPSSTKLNSGLSRQPILKIAVSEYLMNTYSQKEDFSQEKSNFLGVFENDILRCLIDVINHLQNALGKMKPRSSPADSDPRKTKRYLKKKLDKLSLCEDGSKKSSLLARKKFRSRLMEWQVSDDLIACIKNSDRLGVEKIIVVEIRNFLKRSLRRAPLLQFVFDEIDCIIV